MKPKFNNKTCIVVGGASGIGRAAALKFYEEKAMVYVLDKQPSDFEKDKITFIHCDITNSNQCHEAITSVISEAKQIDALFIAAGKTILGNIEETSEEQLNEIVETNFIGTFNMLKAMLPIMKQQQSGSIVMMGSDQSYIGKKRQAAYGATKAAILQLAKSTAIDYSPYNIRINSICPGTTQTPFLDEALEELSHHCKKDIHELKHIFENSQPIKRLATPEDIANAVAFLCSDEASYITGTGLLVDGGYTAQ